MTDRIAVLGLSLVILVTLALAGCDKPSTISQDLGPSTGAAAKLAAEQHGVFSPLDTITWEIKSLDPAQHITAMNGWVGLENGEGSKPVPAQFNTERGTWVIDIRIPETLPRDSRFWVNVTTDSGTEKAWWNYEVTQR